MMKLLYGTGIILTAILLTFSLPVQSKTWETDYNNSQLGFVGTQGSTPFQGSFGKFNVVIEFDLDHPELGQISSTIDTGSANAGSEDRNSYLPQADWFFTSQFPTAKFVSMTIHKTGDNSYEALGNLTIKGITKSVVLPFSLTKETDHWRATGKMNLLRTDFHVGEHDWANEDQVKFAVDVLINLSVKPKP